MNACPLTSTNSRGHPEIDVCAQSSTRVLVCVFVCVCARVCPSLALFLFSLCRLLSVLPSLCFPFSPFLSLSLSVSVCLFLCVIVVKCLCIFVPLSPCPCVSLSLCLYVSLCLDCKCTHNRDTIVSSTHLQRISSKSIHEFDEMSGSTPQTVIHRPFDVWQSREFKIKKETLAPEFPRKKERNKNKGK